VQRVILPDERLGIGPHHPGNGADVTPSVKIAAAGGVVAALDAGDDCFPDAGPLTDLGNAEAGPLTGRGQEFTDRHPRLHNPA